MSYQILDGLGISISHLNRVHPYTIKKKDEKKRLTADDFNDGGDDNEQLVPVCL